MSFPRRVGASRRRLAACAAMVVLALAADGARAGLVILEPGLYRLHDHNDGGIAPPLYGLRLDELLEVTPDLDRFTFSFDGEGAEVLLELGDDASIHISGTVRGGLDIGQGWDPALSGLWDIDFTYDTSKPEPGGDDDIVVNPPDVPNMGAITPLFGDDAGIPIELFDFAGSNPFTFRLGDEDDDLGHRGFDGISGWGWLSHGTPDNHVDASDWLFTLDPTIIPGPPAAAAMLIGLMAGRRPRSRRRPRSNPHADLLREAT